MLQRLGFWYRVTKPRPNDSNTRSLRLFRREMKDARRRAHLEAVAYQNKIEDEFLKRHMEETERKHFNNQCAFRQKIARNSYLMLELEEKNKASHQDRLDRLQKYVHEQEVKKLNRIRIKKILEFESQNYWLKPENINEKIIAENVLPEYIGSTEYYHRLHSEALAYDNLQFDLVEQLSNTEEAIKQKNSMLMPIFREFIELMRRLKFDAAEVLKNQHETILNQIEVDYRNDESQKKKQREKAIQSYEQKLKSLKDELNSGEKKREHLFEKVKLMIHTLKKWKEYTDTISLTSSEILQLISQKKMEKTIINKKKTVMHEMASQKGKEFVNPVEEDTEDDEISLEEYLTKYENKEESDPNSPAVEQRNQELEDLLENRDLLFEELGEKIQEEEIAERKRQAKAPNVSREAASRAIEESLEIDDSYLSLDETTSSIETLKEEYKDDGQMQKMLNIAGQLSIEYPKLFKKIWDSQVL